jgi:hypothetical protein
MKTQVKNELLKSASITDRHIGVEIVEGQIFVNIIDKNIIV